MGRLFWKIFLSFWLIIVLSTLGVAWGITQFYQQEEIRPPGGRAARVIAIQEAAITASLKHSGETTTKHLLQELESTSRIRMYVVNNQGDELLGRSLPTSLTNQKTTFTAANTVYSAEGHAYRVIYQPPGRFQNTHQKGEQLYKGSSISPIAFGMPWGRLFERDPWMFAVRTGLALLISGLVCFALTWYLVTPVRRLREASHKFAEGNLDTRVAHAIGRRSDEIADLGHDFDQMAERIQKLISSQKQLLNDISHELRSPLARLRLALGLAQKKLGPQTVPELERIERETVRLDELVGQALTLARLESKAMTNTLDDYIDITSLLEEIIQDANFEAEAINCHICYSYNASTTLNGNIELLHRAFENIIRNALHYTEENSNVDINLTIPEKQNEKWIQISVCDHGPGVPEEQLSTLFDPFVRISEDRNRKDGGYGLGLAIAKQAVQLHGGMISAKNRRDGHGLCVLIRLPMQEDPHIDLK
ncbi:ATP-binding protein [Pseudomonadota bacterium]